MEKRITPANFGSDTPPPRIIGTECEYSVQTSDESFSDIEKMVDGDVTEKIGQKRINQFNSNGAKVHRDVGQLEYASPESIGPEDGVISDLAGIEVVRRLAMASCVSCDGIYRQTGSFMGVRVSDLKNGKGENENTTRGFHENYQVPKYAVETDYFAATFPTFLASKLFDGQGTVLDSGYALKQKIWATGTLEGDYGVAQAQGRKPMYSLRDDEQETVHDGWRRLELRCVDASMSPHARLLALGTTSLLLRLYEHPQFLEDTELRERTALSDPVGAAKTFAKDLSFGRTVGMESGNDETALSLQETFLEACEKLSESISLPEDETYSLRLWRDVLDRQRRAKLAEGEFAGLEKLSDNVALYAYLFKKFPQDKIHVRNLKAMAACQIWDRILPTGGAIQWWEKHPSRRIPEDSVSERINTPPATRAKRRSKAIWERSTTTVPGWSQAVNDKGGVINFGDGY